MRPKRIILIRHGRSEANADGAVRGTIPDFALNLTDEGIEQARRASRKIREIVGSGTIRAYISPYYRTRQTFQYLQESLMDNIVRTYEDPRIREQDWGHLRDVEANEEIEHQRNTYSTFYYRIPDGESGADVFDRVSSFLDTLHRDFESPNYAENALIVTHGLTLRLFLMRWFHWSVEEYEKLKNPENCQIVVLVKNASDRYDLVSELKRRG